MFLLFLLESFGRFGAKQTRPGAEGQLPPATRWEGREKSDLGAWRAEI